MDYAFPEGNMDAKNYINGIKSKFNISKISELLDKPKDIKVIVLGDTIIDEYVFSTLKGLAIKDPIISVDYKYHETYAGGILAVANHLSNFATNVKLITLLGEKESREDFVKEALNDNIDLKTFIKKDAHTTVKKRYVDAYRNNKLFKIEYMNDKPISDELANEIIAYLSEELPKYDLVVVGDFGHGFINSKIRELLEEKSKFLSINVQSNSANMGYNYINHYKSPDFIVMNEEELRLPLMKRFEELKNVVIEFHDVFKHKKFLITLGKKGGIFFNNGKIYEAPAFIKKVVDTVGAGDAFFAVASLFAHMNLDDEITLFLGNCAGGVKSNYMGNKESVTKEKLLNFIEKVYEDGME